MGSDGKISSESSSNKHVYFTYMSKAHQSDTQKIISIRSITIIQKMWIFQLLIWMVWNRTGAKYPTTFILWRMLEIYFQVSQEGFSLNLLFAKKNKPNKSISCLHWSLKGIYTGIGRVSILNIESGRLALEFLPLKVISLIQSSKNILCHC